ncbi:hypothetical protein BEWA_021540 [Theileria equi strain WA]|uniref:Nuclear pore protein n=1 Tax=Theileria equi strain WA TaxID=1537102 RepID=L0AWA2_THEEQ|nr:hypothetical protein BEWA_021540 [Theileria equi strain WA]AFZ79306.1 hypothetical protein BEWA_021540 [Theileria equi strain WA]|eukprot:XP_004828972.1 hypothetical protein BEWA_021540 [Theileria equi strain WA]
MDWDTFSASALGPLESTTNSSFVVNLFELSKDLVTPTDKSSGKGTNLDSKNIDNNINIGNYEESSLDYHKDLRLWDQDKRIIIDIVTNRLKKIEDASLPSCHKSHKDLNHSDVPEAVLSSECEVLISWMDRHFSTNSKITPESHRIFVESITKLFESLSIVPTDFVDFLLDIGKLGNTKSPTFLSRYLKLSLKNLQKNAWKSLQISILNTKGIFLDSLLSVDSKNPVETLKKIIECANIIFPGQASISNSNSKIKDSEYYFFIAFLSFRCGFTEGFDILSNKEVCDTIPQLENNHFPPLFVELCGFLKEILLDRQNKDDKQLLLSRFAGEYSPTKHDNQNSFLSRGCNFYALLLLSILYPDYYSPCDSSMLLTKDDYLWYQLNLILVGAQSSMISSVSKLCHALTKEINTINIANSDVVEKIFFYAYSIALAGGVLEALRLLMSAVKTSYIQTFAVIFVVYFENTNLFDSEDLTYIAYSLWNLEEKSHANSPELPYLIQLAFNRKRNLSPEIKILLSTLLPHPKSLLITKYAVAENFHEAIDTRYLGSYITRNGMLAIGPLLQKLVKLSTRRASAKYAISLLAQYSAHVGLWVSAFKCFYCIRDIDNCASVLEACCCYIFDGNEAKTFTIDDLCVYYSLIKSIAPNNKQVLELKNIFDCISLCVLARNGEHHEAVIHCKKNKIFENSAHILRNESHQIYFNALVHYINALKNLVSSGQQPSDLLTPSEANELLDLLESSYQNVNSNKDRTIDAFHTLLTFISIVPPKS